MLKKILILLFIPFLLCSCSKQNYEELTFSSWGSITETQILEKLIKIFEKENPQIKINFIHVPQNYFQKLHLLFASNQAPDVIFMNNLYLPVYVQQLEPLDNIVNKDDYYPNVLEALSYNEHLYVVPRDISNLVFYCNKELLHLTNKNWKFNDFKKVLEQDYKSAWVIGFEPDVYYAVPYIMTFGGNIIENYNGQETQNALSFYKNLEGKYAPSRADVGSSTLAQMFLDKKIALYLSGRWMYPKINEKAEFDWEILPFPGITSLDSSGWAISKDSRHKESAYKFVKYLASNESSKYFAETGLIVPARKDSSEILYNAKEKVFLDVIKTSEKTPVCINYRKITDKINKEF